MCPSCAVVPQPTWQHPHQTHSSAWWWARSAAPAQYWCRAKGRCAAWQCRCATQDRAAWVTAHREPPMCQRTVAVLGVIAE
eukprot:scaffold13230_cov98-Isochrysis_galbana.AAC.5